MRIENCTLRVNKSSSATEVFITSETGVNTVLYLPPDAQVNPAEPLEFVPAPPPPAENPRKTETPKQEA